MKIYPISDVHLDHNGPIHWTFNFRPQSDEIVVVAGDIASWARYRTKNDGWDRTTKAKAVLDSFMTYLSRRSRHVIVVLGNHDYNGTIIDIDGPAYWDCDNRNVPRISELYDFSALGNVTVLHAGNWMVIDDVAFVGATLWTDVNRRDPVSLVLGREWLHQDFHHTFVRRGRDPIMTQEMSPADWARLHDIDVSGLIGGIMKTQFTSPKKVVVVTHMAPFSPSTPDQYRGQGQNCFFTCSDIDRLAGAFGTKLWIHGHTHTACDYKIAGMRVVCNPFGYGNQFVKNGFEFDKIVEV